MLGVDVVVRPEHRMLGWVVRQKKIPPIENISFRVLQITTQASKNEISYTQLQ